MGRDDRGDTLTLDFEQGVYEVAGYRGVAWRLDGYVKEWHSELFVEVDEDGEVVYVDESDGEWVEDTGRVVAHMVGDDRPFEFGVDELTVVEGNVCSCGQIGCGWDGGE